MAEESSPASRQIASAGEPSFETQSADNINNNDHNDKSSNQTSELILPSHYENQTTSTKENSQNDKSNYDDDDDEMDIRENITSADNVKLTDKYDCKHSDSPNSTGTSLGVSHQHYDSKSPETLNTDENSEHTHSGPEADFHLDYAEVLYKCSLCSTVPAILTSPSHFSCHVKEVHLTSTGHRCPRCHLHFYVMDDVYRHCSLFHLGDMAEQDPANQSPATDIKHNSIFTERSVTNGLENKAAVQCRSRRKRSYPRHLETKEQSHSRSASTDSSESTLSGGSRSSELDHQPPLVATSSPLPCDRKRLLPWSQRTHKSAVTVAPSALNSETTISGTNSSHEANRRGTICYKPEGCSQTGEKSPQNQQQHRGVNSEGVQHQGPLDLVLQDRSRSSDTPAVNVNTNQSNTEIKQQSKRIKLNEMLPLTGSTNQLTHFPARDDAGQLPLAGMSPQSQYETLYAAWSQNFFNLPRQHAAVLASQLNNPNTRCFGSGSLKLKEETLESMEKVNPSCGQCKLEFSSAESFCLHYKEHHLPNSAGGGQSGGAAGDQQFKVLWLKQHMHKFLVQRTDGGVVLRDELLDHMMSTGVDTSDAATWGPACNRAVRETFPDSQAHRKGKFKNCFFGVGFVDSLTSSTLEDTRRSLQQEDEGTDDDDLLEDDLSEEERAGVGFKGSTQDLEKLTAHLPCIIRWTGHMDACITRDSLLQALSRRLDDCDVINWGLQCSRAVRQLFPQVAIRRKGKYKTCYYGIEMINRGQGRQGQLATWSRTSAGPPVVNVKDILETPGPCSMSRLPRHQPTQTTSMTSHPGKLKPTSPSNTNNPLQAILSLLPTGFQSHPVKITLPPSMTPYLVNQKGSEVQRVVNSSRSNSPISDGADVNRTSMTPDYDVVTSSNERPLSSSPQDRPLELTTKSSSNTDTNAPSSPTANENQLQPFTADRSFLQPTSGPIDGLEKLLLLHPGPFVSARIFSRRFQRLVTGHEKVDYAMTMLQSRGLGQVYTLKQGNSKVFFKCLPTKSLEMALTVLGVRMVDYQVMFYEKDQKLDDSLHSKLKSFYPQPELLANYYNH